MLIHSVALIACKVEEEEEECVFFSPDKTIKHSAAAASLPPFTSYSTLMEVREPQLFFVTKYLFGDNTVLLSEPCRRCEIARGFEPGRAGALCPQHCCKIISVEF